MGSVYLCFFNSSFVNSSLLNMFEKLLKENTAIILYYVGEFLIWNAQMFPTIGQYTGCRYRRAIQQNFVNTSGAYKKTLWISQSCVSILWNCELRGKRSVSNHCMVYPLPACTNISKRSKFMNIHGGLEGPLHFWNHLLSHTHELMSRP